MNMRKEDFEQKVSKLSKYYKVSLDSLGKTTYVRYRNRKVLSIRYYHVKPLVSPETFHTLPFSNRLYMLASEYSLTKQEDKYWLINRSAVVKPGNAGYVKYLVYNNKTKSWELEFGDEFIYNSDYTLTKQQLEEMKEDPLINSGYINKAKVKQTSSNKYKLLKGELF